MAYNIYRELRNVELISDTKTNLFWSMYGRHFMWHWSSFLHCRCNAGHITTKQICQSVHYFNYIGPPWMNKYIKLKTRFRIEEQHFFCFGISFPSLLTLLFTSLSLGRMSRVKPSAWPLVRLPPFIKLPKARIRPRTCFTVSLSCNACGWDRSVWIGDIKFNHDALIKTTIRYSMNFSHVN